MGVARVDGDSFESESAELSYEEKDQLGPRTEVWSEKADAKGSTGG